MTGYKYEVWEDHTGPKPLYCVRVTDPLSKLVGEVKSLAELTALELAHELKKNDSPRFKAEHNLF